MHICHLAIYPDVLCSFLLDVAEGGHRELQLTAYWENYKDWSEAQGSCTWHSEFFCVYVSTNPASACIKSIRSRGLQDRCERKLFSSSVLKPKSESYINISQKILSATAARYMILWLCNLVRSLLADATFEKSQEFLPLGLYVKWFTKSIETRLKPRTV